MIEPAFLLDANICVYLLGGNAHDLRMRIEEREQGELATSSVAFAEVMIGAVRRDAIDEALHFFQAIPVLPFDERAGRAYARLPFKRGSFDRLIAAHALALGLTLITNNTRDFADIPDLRVENWTE